MQGRRMRVQEISGKDVHNMKARSLIKRGLASSQEVQGCLEKGQGLQGGLWGVGVQAVQGCLGGSRGLGGVSGGSGQKHEKTRKTLRSCMARLLRSNIQDFMQDAPVGKWLRVPPFSACRAPQREVKPPKCPTRHPRVGGYHAML